MPVSGKLPQKKSSYRSTVLTNNRPRAMATKVDLRTRVFGFIPESQAHVLDCYCGLDGLLYDAVWRRAASYCGIDTEWHISDPRDRYVGDCMRVLRAIPTHELSRFNIFDMDPWGEPWPALVMIAKRRHWAAGELGAVTLTDGSETKLRFGRSSDAVKFLTGQSRFPTGPENALRMQRDCRAAWLKLMGCELVTCFEAVSQPRLTGAHRGGPKMMYSTIVFRGV